MELISPGLGLLFWTLIIFLTLFLLLRKFAFPAINKMLKEREESIDNALEQAEISRKEMSLLKAKNEELLDAAKAERESILRDTYDLKKKIETESRENAREEYARILQEASKDIEREKNAAIEELKVEIANISLSIAEKILEKEFSNKQAHKDFIEKELQNIDLDYNSTPTSKLKNN